MRGSPVEPTITFSVPDTSTSTTEPPAQEPGSRDGSDSSPAEPGDGVISLDDAVEIAKIDLADRLQIDTTAITVVHAQATTWNDSSLGCPDKGLVYLPVLTPGYQVVLAVGGAEYDYRLDVEGNLKLCSG